MVAFLSEIKKRTRCVSIIWLHDGLWVPKELSNSLLLSCEQIAARQTFPTLPTWNIFESKISLYHGSSLKGRDIWAILETSFHLPLIWYIRLSRLCIPNHVLQESVSEVVECVKKVAVRLKKFRLGILVLKLLTSCPLKFGISGWTDIPLVHQLRQLNCQKELTVAAVTSRMARLTREFWKRQMSVVLRTHLVEPSTHIPRDGHEPHHGTLGSRDFPLKQMLWVRG